MCRQVTISVCFGGKFVTIVTRELWEQIKGSPLDTIWQERRRDGQNYRDSHYKLTHPHFSVTTTVRK